MGAIKFDAFYKYAAYYVTNTYVVSFSRIELLVSELKTQGPESLSAKPVMNRDLAAVKLQKMYKGFRTRRQLADSAVSVEQTWWKALDYAQLKSSSVSSEVEKPETAVSRWSRARTLAAKVGKGVSKNEKAQKLALQHWLEAIDPRHRYGRNLQYYYDKWLLSENSQPFFYWLDIGEGKDVDLKICPRTKLFKQCIKYLGPSEREEYEVIVEDGKFMYKLSKTMVDTTEDTKWIFVLSPSMVLYVGKKQKGKFEHSSFLAGGATLSAGRLVIIDGILKAVWPYSGHYLPTEENFHAFISFLKQHRVDLHAVKVR
ncbi:IQ domain-containing protein IQM6-like [Rutidosis leptorrhynchoides]|uniref:IQ domain-containing protein IQM6-like n=1 Tax=Rutidosis leptorrhynchoides TaxID=125765 RepID=UPI003A99228D